MPIYDYVCSRCGHRLEVVHGIHGHGPKSCASCGAEGTMSKAFMAPAIHFKGSGWAKKDRSATATPGPSRGSTAPAPSKATASDAASGDAGSSGAIGSTSSETSDSGAASSGGEA